MVIAITFILSGFVKAIDPLGTQYKIGDYLEAWGMGSYAWPMLTLALSVASSAVEFLLGISMLFAIRRRLTSKLTLAVMALFTPLTLWLAIAEPVSDCGCFGDAIVLTGWQSFGKNIILLACAIVTCLWPIDMAQFVKRSNRWIVINFSTIFIIAMIIYSLYMLPLFDFRPYHIGADIRKGMEIPQGAKQPEFETVFILEKNGERREFDLNNYPDSTWTFIDSRTVMTQQGYVPPIHDFSIVDMTSGDDITEKIIGSKGYTFLLISPHLEQANDSQYEVINEICEYTTEHGHDFICLTASGMKGVKTWQEMTGAEYEFYNTDETTLKTMIRSNPGLMLIKNGVIIQKWSHNAMPDKQELMATLKITQYDNDNKSNTANKVIAIMLWFVLPLCVLTIADRLWTWSRWLREKEMNSSIYQLLNKKKMRKKIVAGNWKMNLNLQEGVALAKELNDALTNEKPNCSVVICTPFIHLASIDAVINKEVIGLGAENCADKEKGAYTGEVSAEMVKSTGADYVILGHSERRGYYGETPEILKEKVMLALKNNLKVIFCIGESLEEREANKQNEVVKAELEGSVFNLSADDFKNIIIAYEPIWAIGTGKTATAEQAEEIHAFIRSTIAEKYGEEIADQTSILYGGSCKASNAPELFAKPDIDGGLIGGASLKVADFKGIIDAWK